MKLQWGLSNTDVFERIVEAERRRPPCKSGWVSEMDVEMGVEMGTERQ